MRTELLMATAISLCLVSCSDNGGAIDAPNPPIPEPEEVTITINHDKIRLAVGETVPIDFSVEPEDAPLEWNSSDSRIATVDGNGNVTAIARGSVSVTASSGTAKTSVPVIVERAIAVGDYYYSDGTTSDAIISGKTILGVVFWLGNATTDDAALRRDHPECTHGLAVAAFSELNPSPWQSTCNTYNSTTGSWVENNVGDLYQSPVSLYQRDTRRSMTLGYNNTKALEAFNAANPSYLVEAIQAVEAYRSRYPAPASSSGWFLPSTKELSLLINDIYDGEVLDFNNAAKNKRCINKAKINASLSKVPEAQLIGRTDWAYDFWTSTDYDAKQAYFVSAFDGSIMCVAKDGRHNQMVRCVLAF